MDHGVPINHLVKLYEIAESPGASDNEEENLYIRLFPHSLIGRGKGCYMDKPATTLNKFGHYGGQVH